MTHTPSGREMADVAVAQGAIDMAQGVVHTAPPQLFLEKLEEFFLERASHTYASPGGYLGYREALVSLVQEERAMLKLENVVATNGVTGGLISALRDHCDSGDQVLLMEPFYPAHDWAIEALRLNTHYLPYKDDLTIDIELIEQSLDEVSAVLIANPANPTGTTVRLVDLMRLYEMCLNHDVLLIVDEVYRDFIWEGEYGSLLAEDVSLSHLVVLRSWSKNLALAGWRVGYAVTDEGRAHRMIHNIHEAFYVGAPAAPQVVMADLLVNHWEALREFMDDNIKLYRENRRILAEAFQGVGYIPLPKEGAYYMLLRHKRESDLVAMQELLAKGIAVAPGTPFYRSGTAATGFLRMHFALSENDREKVLNILDRG